MPERMRVLVIGATRGTGRIVVQRLLEEGHSVRVLARTPARARQTFGDRVEVVAGDLTRRETLAPALDGMQAIVLTAGVTKRPAPERLVKATEYDGTLNVLAAAREAGFQGRLLYMSAIGTDRRSVLAFLLNVIKGNTLKWRARGEEEIRGSGIEYTIVHAGILSNQPAGRHRIRITRQRLPMRLRYRLGRADAAEILVQALADERARNQNLDAVWTRGDPQPREALLDAIE